MFQITNAVSAPRSTNRNASHLQAHRLPRPVLNTGGYLKELGAHAEDAQYPHPEDSAGTSRRNGGRHTRDIPLPLALAAECPHKRLALHPYKSSHLDKATQHCQEHPPTPMMAIIIGAPQR